MRFFEYEAREIVKRAGIPVTDYGFATTDQEAREIAHRIGGPTVIKSQVLTGGRMKAGGVKFADSADEAADYAKDILALEIGGHMPRGVLVDPKAEVKQEYYAGVVWDGLRKQPVMIFSPGWRHRHRAGGRGAARQGGPPPLLDDPALQRLHGEGDNRVHRGRRASAHPHHPHPRPARAAVHRLRHDARRDQPAGRARGRLVRGARRAHGHGERGPAAPEGAPQGARRGRRGDSRGPRADRVRAGRRGGRLDGPPRRGRQCDRVRRRPRPRDRRRRRLAHALRRGPRARRPARRTTARSAATRRSARPPGWRSWCSRSRAWTRSR